MRKFVSASTGTTAGALHGCACSYFYLSEGSKRVRRGDGAVKAVGISVRCSSCSDASITFDSGFVHDAFILCPFDLPRKTEGKRAVLPPTPSDLEPAVLRAEDGHVSHPMDVIVIVSDGRQMNNNPGSS